MHRTKDLQGDRTTPKRKRFDTLAIAPQKIELPGLRVLKEEAKSNKAKTPTSSNSRVSPLSKRRQPTVLQQS